MKPKLFKLREILFRGKSRGEWLEGNLLRNENGACFIAKICSNKKEEPFWFVLPGTVGEYTGIVDKSGNKIFEGDIVNVKSKMKFRNNSHFWYENKDGAVEMSQGHWVINLQNNFLFLGNEEMEVTLLGNIHDAPELLGGKDE